MACRACECCNSTSQTPISHCRTLPSTRSAIRHTHDNQTVRGWFEGGPGDRGPTAEMRHTQQAALALTGGQPETIHHDMIRAALASPATVAIAPAQDYLGLGSNARFNTPGTATGNWRWRIRDIQLDREFCDNTVGIVAASGRQFPSAGS
ncbi:MAG: 4-alpha-glucanotransferase [Woeseiaceae bacterium]|nr:4-alpha-glucanotransferase [Woeseiaceae bacterium]